MPYPVPLFQSTGRPAAAAAGSGGSSEHDAAAFSYPSWAYPRNYIAPSRNRQVRIWTGGVTRQQTGGALAARRRRTDANAAAARSPDPPAGGSACGGASAAPRGAPQPCAGEPLSFSVFAAQRLNLQCRAVPCLCV